MKRPAARPTPSALAIVVEALGPRGVLIALALVFAVALVTVALAVTFLGDHLGGIIVIAALLLCGRRLLPWK